jgi:hypothetical protein
MGFTTKKGLTLWFLVVFIFLLFLKLIWVAREDAKSAKDFVRGCLPDSLLACFLELHSEAYPLHAKSFLFNESWSQKATASTLLHLCDLCGFA